MIITVYITFRSHEVKAKKGFSPCGRPRGRSSLALWERVRLKIPLEVGTAWFTPEAGARESEPCTPSP
jgi:hypothetical protein